MELRRPTTIDDVLGRLAGFRSDEAAASLDRFVARPSDVFICTYSKSGTTWMQQVVHQLRSGASMAFREISEVVPWIESAVDMGIDPAADQAWTPRAFKSHLTWTEAPRGGRYITVFRDPMTVLPSFYRFFEGWWFEPGSVSIDEFARGLYLGGSASGRHWDHLLDWWSRLDRPDVLALSYEDMLVAPDAVPPIVADFLGLELDAATMATVVEHCSRPFMNRHAEQFSEHLLREHRDHVWGLPPGGDAAKVSPGSAVELTGELADELDAMWQRTLGAELGLGSYSAFRAALPNPLGVDRSPTSV